MCSFNLTHLLPSLDFCAPWYDTNLFRRPFAVRLGPSPVREIGASRHWSASSHWLSRGDGCGGVSSENFGGLLLSPQDPGEVRPWEERDGPGAGAGAAGFLHLDCRGTCLVSFSFALTDKNAVLLNRLTIGRISQEIGEYVIRLCSLWRFLSFRTLVLFCRGLECRVCNFDPSFSHFGWDVVILLCS
jgi:hypothetical protein